MRARELSIPGLWEFLPDQFPDNRGNFFVWYDSEVFARALGYELAVGQTNNSTSRRGAIRGIHWADVPPGQAKYAYCPRGTILDIVVDVRLGSPTFGRHEVVRLDPVDCRAVFAAEGLGHSLVALEEGSVLSYLCSTRYRPENERVIDVFDPELAIPWPSDFTAIRSERDRHVPDLAGAFAAGILPSYEVCLRHYDGLRANRMSWAR